MIFGDGKCPKCEKTTNHLEIKSITIGDKLNGPIYRGFSAVCPSCYTIVSAGIDPRALRTDIVDGICEALGVKPKTR